MNFTDLDLHPAVADALAARGYGTATPVQAAVLNADNLSRDLLVSSQTGSGKTVAFGAALANTLLGPGAAPRGQRTAPIALVVVPTRELAIQVRHELGWLLEKTGLRLASFTGGTAVTGDLRVLQRGVDVAIGTPGRLVDLLRRQRLELAHIRVVVLDEADEMLDLGFREDLQTLLQEAPAERRTLLLSATLPAEIQALARRFQRDALPIDPRKGAGPAARAAHDDITFVAHLIAGADRLAVVVNVLRAAGNGRAIVFCTTREGVSRLHAALVARGFAATAISGERAQAERDRALEQVRSGEARILVATNVAARGLHLPDVDLIVHADLPLNAESLTHRSGRTGRAGRKGTAVVIASLSERRKAERLLGSAHVPAVWTPPPSADAITAAARERLVEELLADAAPEATKEDPTVLATVARLEATLPAGELARRLLVREFARLPVGERIHPIAAPGPGSSRRDHFDDARGGEGRPGDRPRARERSRDEFSRAGVLFRVNIGAKDNADPRWLLPLICRRGGVTRREVGSIRVGPAETVFEIAGDAAADYALAASERDPRAPHVNIERARPAGNGRPPERARPAVAPRNDRPAGAPRNDRPAGAPRVERPAAPPRVERPAVAPRVDRPAVAPRVERPAVPPRVERPAVAPRVERPAVASRIERPALPRAPHPPTAPRLEQPAPPPPAREHSKKSVGESPSNRSGRPKPHAPVIEMKRSHRPGHAVDRGRAHQAESRPGELRASRPRTDGNSPLKRSFGSPEPHPQPRAPFWKDGARRRPVAPERHHKAEGHAAKGKPPAR